MRDVAVELAESAGQELLRRRSGGLVAESKGRRRELVTAADRAAERIVVGGTSPSARFSKEQLRKSEF